jgi:hypothetical protein
MYHTNRLQRCELDWIGSGQSPWVGFCDDDDDDDDDDKICVQ